MIYDLIAKTLNNYLGGDYLIEYANNHDTNWDAILPEAQEKIKYGVLRVDSGTTQQIGGQTIRTEQLRLIVAIPEDRDIFNEAVANLRSILDALNNTTITDTEEDTTALLNFGNYNDAQSQTVNGQKWWVAEVVFIANFYNSVCDYTNTKVTIKLTSTGNYIEMKGIMQVQYQCQKTFDGIVFNQAPLQKGFVNGLQKTLQVNCVYLANDNVIFNILNTEENIDKRYDLTYSNGILQRTLDNAVVASITETTVTGDIVKAQITFTTGA